MGDTSSRGGLLTRIVLRNLHNLLHLAALCLLLPCLLTALFKAISPPALLDISSILGHFYITYLVALSRKDWSLALLNVPDQPDQDVVSSAGRVVVHKLAVVVFSLLVLVNVKEAYIDPAWMILAISRDFGMVAMVVTIGGTIYAAQKLSRSGPQGKEVELELRKSRGKWANKALKWCLYTVRASTWVSGIAFWVLFVWSSQLEFAAQRHDCWWKLCSGVVVGASVVGMPPFLLACLLSTKAALYFSCSSYFTAAPHDDDQLLRTPLVPPSLAPCTSSN